MAEPTGAICNLDCAHCFFLSREPLCPGDRFRMADVMLETYVRRMLESQSGPEVVIAFLAEHEFLVGQSIDGPGGMRDMHGVDWLGRGTFDRVMAGRGRHPQPVMRQGRQLPVVDQCQGSEGRL